MGEIKTMNQLENIQKLTPAEIYSSKSVDEILNRIKAETEGFKPDVSTASGRKEIASIAYKIAQSKTFMDECGKKLGEDAKKQLDTINAERKKIRDTLDQLKEEVRKPLTEWEKQDESRKAAHRERIVNIKNISNQIAEQWQTLGLDMMNNRLELIQSFTDWDEFKEETELQIKIGVEKISNSIQRRMDHDKQQEELRVLRAEKEARDKAEAERVEKENAIKLAEIKAAEDAARIKAESEAKARAEEQRKQEEASREKARIEREKQLALEREQAVAREKELAEKRVKEAEAKAAKEKEEAVLRERKRVEDEKKRELEAEQKRQANLKHRAKINNEILAALVSQGFNEEQGKKFITVVVSGLIPYTKISY